MTDTTKGEKHLTPLQPSPAYDGLPLQNEQQREPIVSLGQRTKGLPKLIKKTRDRLGTSEAATTSLLGRGQRGKGAQKHNALHRKLLVSLVVVSVLVASTVLISRKRSEVGAQIRSSAKALLAKLGCSSVHSSSGRGRTATSHGGRRLGGTSPEVDPSAQLEIECATALGLSRVDGDRTGKKQLLRFFPGDAWAAGMSGCSVFSQCPDTAVASGVECGGNYKCRCHPKTFFPGATASTTVQTSVPLKTAWGRHLAVLTEIVGGMKS